MTITITIIVITCLVSFAAFNNHKILDDLIFWPPAISRQNQYYRFITCGFIHADYTHLLFNMFTLYFFGRIMEEVYKETMELPGYYFVILYLGALIVSSIPTYIKHRNDYSYRSLGASGAVSAVLFLLLLFSVPGR